MPFFICVTMLLGMFAWFLILNKFRQSICKLQVTAIEITSTNYNLRRFIADCLRYLNYALVYFKTLYDV